MGRWWESITEARSHIFSLSNILPTSSSSSFSLSSFADRDDPAQSLLTSSDAFTMVSITLSSPLSGSFSDPLCRWLYDTSLSSVPALHLFSLSFLPLISSLYLSKPSLTSFEAIILSFCNSIAQNNNSESLSISIPNLSQPSLYHTPKKRTNPQNVQFMSTPPLEPQVAIKSTERARIIGVALDCYYKNISQIPSWSKINFCQIAATWAGDCCNSDDHSEIKGIVKEMDKLGIKKGGGKVDSDKEAKMPLPWELLQPVLKVLGHCLMGYLCPQDVKDAASVAVRRLYVRANQDLSPQAILATRSLYQLDKRAREEAARKVEAENKALKAKAKSKAKMPEIRLKGNGICVVYISFF